MRRPGRSRPTCATAMWCRTARSITACLRNRSFSSFRDAPSGAGPESILTARLALGPFARFKGISAPPLFSRMRQAARAAVVMDSGLDACASPRNDEELSLHLRRIAVHGIDPQHRLRLLHRLDVEVDGDCLAVAAHQHALQHLIAAGVDLLMRH